MRSISAVVQEALEEKDGQSADLPEAHRERLTADGSSGFGLAPSFLLVHVVTPARP